MLAERRLELRTRGRIVVVLRNAAAHAHHVRECPVRDAFAVGEATAAVPVDVVDQTVEVLVELPRQARLADPGDAHGRDEVGRALLGGGVEELLDAAQLTVAADERGLEAGRLERAPPARGDTKRSEELRGLGFALQLVAAGVLVDDRLLARAARRIADEHRSGFGGRLDSGRRVDEVAGNHPLAFGSDRHSSFAGQDTGPQSQVGGSELLAQGGDRCDEVERGPDGALCVVFGGCRRPPNGHHGVADELLDGAAIQLDQAPARVEVA